MFSDGAQGEGYPAGLVYAIEPSVGLVCACLPVMPALLVYRKPKVKSTYHSESFWRSRISIFSFIRRYSSSEKAASKGSSQSSTPPSERQCRSPLAVLSDSSGRAEFKVRVGVENNARGGSSAKPLPAVTTYHQGRPSEIGDLVL